jgi:hypothetical protein
MCMYENVTMRPNILYNLHASYKAAFTFQCEGDLLV